MDADELARLKESCEQRLFVLKAIAELDEALRERDAALALLEEAGHSEDCMYARSMRLASQTTNPDVEALPCDCFKSRVREITK